MNAISFLELNCLSAPKLCKDCLICRRDARNPDRWSKLKGASNALGRSLVSGIAGFLYIKSYCNSFFSPCRAEAVALF